MPPVSQELEKAYEEKSRVSRYGVFVVSLALSFGLTYAFVQGAKALSIAVKGETAALPVFGSYVAEVIINRGWIPFVELFFFWLAICCLCARLRQRLVEKKRFAVLLNEWNNIRERFGGRDHTVQSSKIPQLADAVEKVDSDMARSMAGKRLRHAIRRFNKTRSAEQVDVVLGTLSDMDAEAFDVAYSHIRYFVWLIPTLGFIGTVVGIGLGIAGFGKIIESAASFTEVQNQIPLVTNNLGIAFDTTLMALLLTAIVLMLSSYLQRRDGDLLAQIDAFCIEEISGSFEEEGMAQKIISAIGQQTRDILQSLERINPVDLGNIEEAMRKMVGSVERVPEVAECAEQIRKDAAELNEAMGKFSAKIDRSLDQSVGSVTKQLEEAIRESSDTSALKVTLEELKKAASDSAGEIKKSFVELQEKLSHEAESVRKPFQELGKGFSGVAERLAEVVASLQNFLVKGGIGQATEFTSTVNELKAALAPVPDVIEQLAGATEKLEGLSNLAAVAQSLNEAAEAMKKAAENAKSGGEGIKGAGDEISGIIAENKRVIETVSNALTQTTGAITQLRNTINSMLQELTGIQGAVQGVRGAVQQIADVQRTGQ